MYHCRAVLSLYSQVSEVVEQGYNITPPLRVQMVLVS